MTIQGIRFRSSEGAVLLQVLERSDEGYEYQRNATWRDAKVEDLLEVARYTRAYDALDSMVSSLTNTVSSLQEQVGHVLDQNHSVLDRLEQRK